MKPTEKVEISPLNVEIRSRAQEEREGISVSLLHVFQRLRGAFHPAGMWLVLWPFLRHSLRRQL